MQLRGGREAPGLTGTRASPGGSEVKNPPAMQEPKEMQVRSLGQEDPLEEGMATTPVFFPGESHVQRSLWDTVHRVSWG